MERGWDGCLDRKNRKVEISRQGREVEILDRLQLCQVKMYYQVLFWI